ncbi:TonB-dependent receptor [Candidatus Endoriftia persephone]|jgi:iron complex outermembrane receptor protein|uniref:TonB-dependent receptor n=1 Tax=Candidatus Endoriftia persephonae TaxID=393765 RepID=A0A9J6ZTR6_9GAMM|nr:TonB-dependent receptor [Candidatus Endoriftia persephone]USF86209.1 TonB-dependent receptor [Candidatus Endoriftia persephone]
MKEKLIISTLVSASLTPSLLFADEPTTIDETANKIIINEGEIKNRNIENIKDVLDTTSGVETDGQSLSVRGVGSDGRGIAVTDDGVSLTDVSGAFSTDIDTSELEKLIVYKGPGSIYSVNGTGGVLKAKSKSVFKMDNNIKATIGSYGYKYLKLNAHTYFDVDSLINFTYSRKEDDNDYKDHSQQRDNRYTLKFGRIISDTSSVEVSFKYNDSFKEKIQSITDSGFMDYLNGNTVQNDGLWVFNSRDTQTKTADFKYRKYINNDLFKVSAFFSTKNSTYYNNGKINVNNDNYNAGIDVEYDKAIGSHELLFGLSYKKDEMRDNYQYKYTDITTGSGGLITSVYGTTPGDVLSVSNSSNYLLGAYAKDDWQINNKIKLEASLRIDSVNFDVDSTEYWKYNGTTEKYSPLPGDIQQVSQRNTLVTPRVALIYGLNSTTNAYISIAQGERSINDRQLLVNIKNDKSTDIDPAKSVNYEFGLKHSSDNLVADVSIYRNIISDEIIEVKDPTIALKYYENAGKVDKKGLELGLKYSFNDFYYVGANYSYMDYKYVTYMTSTGDFSGNTLRSIPDYRYALYAGLKNPVKKLSARIEIVTSGSFYTDDDNTRTYKGYSGVTNAVFGWEPWPNHKLMFNVNNLFDKRYATDASYSATTGLTTYTTAEPRTLKLSYIYKF